MVAVAATVTMLAVMLPARPMATQLPVVAVAAAVLAGQGRCRCPGSGWRRSR